VIKTGQDVMANEKPDRSDFIENTDSALPSAGDGQIHIVAPAFVEDRVSDGLARILELFKNESPEYWSAVESITQPDPNQSLVYFDFKNGSRVSQQQFIMMQRMVLDMLEESALTHEKWLPDNLNPLKKSDIEFGINQLNVRSISQAKLKKTPLVNSLLTGYRPLPELPRPVKDPYITYSPAETARRASNNPYYLAGYAVTAKDTVEPQDADTALLCWKVEKFLREEEDEDKEIEHALERLKADSAQHSVVASTQQQEQQTVIDDSEGLALTTVVRNYILDDMPAANPWGEDFAIKIAPIGRTLREYDIVKYVDEIIEQHNPPTKAEERFCEKLTEYLNYKLAKGIPLGSAKNPEESTVTPGLPDPRIFSVEMKHGRRGSYLCVTFFSDSIPQNQEEENFVTHLINKFAKSRGRDLSSIGIEYEVCNPSTDLPIARGGALRA
jgi:hypothetical protein